MNDQAKARVEMNVQGYAKYLTPEAVDSLRASFPGIPPRVGSYEIASAEQTGGDWQVEVRYISRDDSFVVRSRWHTDGSGWSVTHAERLWAEGDKRPGFLSKLVGSVLRVFAGRRSKN